MGTGREELPAPGARAAPGHTPRLHSPPPRQAGPLPTGTYQVALVPRGLIVAITALGTERAAVARAADTQAGPTPRAVAIASPVAAAGLPGPAGTGCTGKDQLAGSQGGGQHAGGSPSSLGTPTSTALMPQLLTPAVGAIGAGRAAECQPVHAQPLEEVGVLLPPGEGGTWRSAPCHPPVPPCPHPQTHSWNHHCSTCSSLCSSSWWQAKSEGAQTLSSTSSRRVSLWGQRDQHGHVSPWGSWGPLDPPPPAGEHPPVLVLGQLLLLPGRVAPTKAFVLCPLQALGTWGGGQRRHGTPR